MISSQGHDLYGICMFSPGELAHLNGSSVSESKREQASMCVCVCVCACPRVHVPYDGMASYPELVHTLCQATWIGSGHVRPKLE